MNTGTVDERCEIPAKTFGYYECIGLIASADRQPNGYRTYGDINMHGLRFIKRAHHLGFSVEEVRDRLDLWREETHTSGTVKTLAMRQSETRDRKIAEFKSVRRTLAHLIDRCRGDDCPNCPILDDLGNAAMPGMRGKGNAGKGRALPTQSR